MQNFRNPLILTAPKIYLDTSQLPAGGGDVSEWNSFATVEVGGAGLPTLKTDETDRYVRFGTTDANHVKGNYLNLGTQTWNLQNGFTFVGVLRIYESKSWQRIFDFDNKVTGTGTITSYAARTLTNNWIGRSNWSSDSYACLDVREMAFYDRSLTDSELSDVVGHLHDKYFSDPLLRKVPIRNIHLDASQLPQLSIDNTNVSSWNSFATAEVGGAGLPKLRTNEPNRIPSANLVEAFIDPSSYLLDNKVTGNGTITNYSSRTTTDNSIAKSTSSSSYSCLDVREMAFYDLSLTDSQLSNVVSYMRIKHFGDSIPTLGPLSIKSILDFVDPGGSSGENPYAMDKLFRGSRTPNYISSITRIPLAATEPTRISFADFRGAGLIESPADVIGLYAWYTPERWDVGTKSWNDISGNGRHATETRAGTITVGDSTDPLGRSITCISGGTGSGIRFPADVLPETYTLFHLARYSTGGIRKRMFDGLGNNWLSGFHIGGSGLAYHGTWFTPQENLHGDEWVVSCDTKQLYRSNKVQRNNLIVNGNSTRLTINYGDFVAVESSDWACAEVIVFDRELTNAEMLGVEEYLYKKHSLTII
eukprot:gene29856-17951_t